MSSLGNGAFLVGLVGSGIQLSLTPALHERAGDRHGVRYLYQLIDLARLRVGVEALPELLTAAEQMGFNGLNITHPCKQAVIPYLHELSEKASAVGAVNTVVFKAGRRIGHNTDCWGFSQAILESPASKRLGTVVQLGAGGAGAAVAYAVLSLGAARLVLFDRDETRAESLAAKLAGRFGADRVVASSDLPAAMATADGLIHATPTGTAAHPGLPLPAQLLRSTQWVVDIVYFPLETELLKVARRRGCLTIDGGGMAIYQAVRAFHHFTDLQADAAHMRRDFDQLVEARDRPHSAWECGR
ncbi:MAG: shikimate dehydrogenase [Rhodanobacter sp.]